MKKSINVNGVNFEINVDISAQDRYESIESDYKKLLYLLGQVSSIGAKVDREFTLRNFLIEKKACIIEDHKEWNTSTEELEEDLRQNACLNVGPELKLSTHQKESILQTIDSAMWWFKSLKVNIENLKK